MTNWPGLTGPMVVVAFDGSPEEFRAECRRRGLADGDLLAREFHGRVYLGRSPVLDGWDRLRPLAPGPYDSEFAPMTESPR